ncbi:PAS domain S-box-containing protein [Tenacibaculum adriaticum]|uniref:PAS domain S-box-containing protein n=1 Tax=Tenacibaculum adriaticum TaxID=413713 RepID=A0A5S5DNP7_9FLAO|nr:PAS domain-containing protein [Tenacibaculum adriaticum]TYP97537.1 PAS domain S-box-containing protein [Tenacibaculum adriaticum]
MSNSIEEYIDKRVIMPLLSWDIFSQFSLNKNDIYNLQDQEIKQLLYFSHKYKWDQNIQSILTKNSYEALVLTNNAKEIIWVNEGFTKMTGYSKEYVKHKTPSFLQGKDTSENKKTIIRKKINNNTPFKEVILNYKKDGTPYQCEIYIIPLKKENTTHYLALEKAI